MKAFDRCEAEMLEFLSKEFVEGRHATCRRGRGRANHSPWPGSVGALRDLFRLRHHVLPLQGGVKKAFIKGKAAARFTDKFTLSGHQWHKHPLGFMLIAGVHVVALVYIDY
ncbi:hypothetical protein CDAR_281261 [Caerostris darwini]|uniref:Uncharacterized protein n=1 Tax=Caerostris darwini TaxID=1538125 RepID=A0AAV4WZ66_9ARAC|nr:hypothetical protein CDAR_281261 [Caerostris darwini]